jgi:hypothetical protein
MDVVVSNIFAKTYLKQGKAHLHGIECLLDIKIVQQYEKEQVIMS